MTPTDQEVYEARERQRMADYIRATGPQISPAEQAMRARARTETIHALRELESRIEQERRDATQALHTAVEVGDFDGATSAQARLLVLDPVAGAVRRRLKAHGADDPRPPFTPVRR